MPGDRHLLSSLMAKGRADMRYLLYWLLLLLDGSSSTDDGFLGKIIINNKEAQHLSPVAVWVGRGSWSIEEEGSL